MKQLIYSDKSLMGDKISYIAGTILSGMGFGVTLVEVDHIVSILAGTLASIVAILTIAKLVRDFNKDK